MRQPFPFLQLSFVILENTSKRKVLRLHLQCECKNILCFNLFFIVHVGFLQVTTYETNLFNFLKTYLSFIAKIMFMQARCCSSGTMIHHQVHQGNGGSSPHQGFPDRPSHSRGLADPIQLLLQESHLLLQSRNASILCFQNCRQSTVRGATGILSVCFF